MQESYVIYIKEIMQQPKVFILTALKGPLNCMFIRI